MRTCFWFTKRGADEGAMIKIQPLNLRVSLGRIGQNQISWQLVFPGQLTGNGQFHGKTLLRIDRSIRITN